MLKSELDHSVLMGREEKPAEKSQARASFAHTEPREDWQGVEKAVHRPSVGRAGWEGLAGIISGNVLFYSCTVALRTKTTCGPAQEGV